MMMLLTKTTMTTPEAIMMMFIVYMSIINPSGDWEDPGSTKVS